MKLHKQYEIIDKTVIFPCFPSQYLGLLLFITCTSQGIFKQIIRKISIAQL